MSRFIFPAVLFFLVGIAANRGKDHINFNGWEFLEWSWSKEKVEKALNKRGIIYSGITTPAYGASTSFYGYGMDIRLMYDAGHLYDIQQYRFYRVSEKAQSDKYYAKKKAKYIKKYGSPVWDGYSEIEKSHVTKWELKYTEIAMYYDDQYMEYTQFPGEAYRLYVHVWQRKN